MPQRKTEDKASRNEAKPQSEVFNTSMVNNLEEWLAVSSSSHIAAYKILIWLEVNNGTFITIAGLLGTGVDPNFLTGSFMPLSGYAHVKHVNVPTLETVITQAVYVHKDVFRMHSGSILLLWDMFSAIKKIDPTFLPSRFEERFVEKCFCAYH